MQKKIKNKDSVITIGDNMIFNDIIEFSATVTDCIDKKDMKEDLHVVIQDAIKKILRCKQDHGY